MAIIQGGRIIPGVGQSEALLSAGAPTNGAFGTYANVAPVGALLTDTVNAELYINKGTMAAPTWTKVSGE